MNKKTIRIGLLSTILFIGSKEAFTQFKPKAYRFSVAKEAIALPTNNPFKGPFHPSASIGFDYNVKSKNRWQRSLGFDLSFFHHRLSENALMLDATYTKGLRIGPLQPKFMAAIGYKHSFPANEVYKLENGEYKKASTLGKSQFNTKLGMGLEYAVNQQYSLITDYRFMVALPYSELLPFSLHSFCSLGIKINMIGKNN
jgi:hypothetical protein